MTTQTQRTPTSVDAWRDHQGDQPWSVSLCDEDGEIRCLQGADTQEEAWGAACEAADEYGVPAQMMPFASGEVTDRYEPDGTHSQTAEQIRDEAAEERAQAERAMRAADDVIAEIER
jgi:hypothetical protein